MTVNRFQVFAAVARHGNISRASHELRISQPSVSQQLRTLEEEFGAKFYLRSGRGIELTSAGRLFLSRIRPILSQVNALNSSFPVVRPRVAACLSVGGSYAPSSSLLPSLLTLFKRNHPQVQIDLRTGSGLGIERLVVNGEIELALITGLPQSPLLIAEPCGRERLVAFVVKSHRLAKTGRLSPQALSRAPLIILGGKKSKGAAEAMVKEIEAQGVHPNIAMRCESPETVKTAVKKGMGVGILYEGVVEVGVRWGQFKAIRLPVRWEAENFIIYHRERSLSANGRNFLTLLRRWRARHRRKRIQPQANANPKPSSQSNHSRPT
jgi:DNA-binding transcriptional LysR family regulator